MKHSLPRRLPAERLSLRVLYVLLVLTALLFAAFFLVGFDRPSLESPGFRDPLFTDVLLWCALALAALALGAGAWALWRGLRQRDGSERVVNGVPAAKISMGVAALTAVVVLLSFVCGSPAPVTVNGSPFADVFWLKAADMFVATSLVLMLVAVGAVVFGYTRYYRKERPRP